MFNYLKYLILTSVLFFIFTGCASKEIVFPKNCSSLTVAEGAFFPLPDIYSGRSRLLVAVQNRKLLDDNSEYRQSGAIYSIPANRSSLLVPDLLKITNRDEMPFHPAYIAALNESKDSQILFVLNYPLKAFPVIEVFQLSKNELIFLYRVRGLEYYRISGIVPVSRHEFLFSNHYSGLLSYIKKNLFSDKIHSVMHYSKGRIRTIITGITDITSLNTVNPAYHSDPDISMRILIAADHHGGLYSADLRSGTWTGLRRYKQAPASAYAYPVDGDLILLSDTPSAGSSSYSRLFYFRLSDQSLITAGKGKTPDLHRLGRAVHLHNMLILGRELSSELFQCSPLSN